MAKCFVCTTQLQLCWYVTLALLCPYAVSNTCVVTVPSWLNEKKRGVSVKQSILYAIVLSCFEFILLGCLAAASLPMKPGDGTDILGLLSSSSKAIPHLWEATRYTASVFSLVALVSGIPVFSIIIRYNVLEQKLCSPLWANLFAVVFPWLVALFFFAGNSINALAQYSSALFYIPLNFVFPAVLFLIARKKYPRVTVATPQC